MKGDKYEPNSIDSMFSSIISNQNEMMKMMEKTERALVEQNRRINVLEVAENKRVGALVAIGTACSFIGAGIMAGVEFLRHK